MTWKTKRRGNIIELRKTFSSHPDYANILIVVSDDGNVVVSMNGKAQMTIGDITEMHDCVGQALYDVSIPELKIAVDHERSCKLTRYPDLRGDARDETVNCSCGAIKK